MTKKSRAICIIDYEIEGNYRDAGKVEEKVEQAIRNLVEGDKQVVHWQVELRERRGDGAPDLGKMKFRAN